MDKNDARRVEGEVERPAEMMEEEEKKEEEEEEEERFRLFRPGLIALFHVSDVLLQLN